MKEKNRSKKNSLVEKAITMSSNLDKLIDRITFISKWLKILSQFIYAAVFTEQNLGTKSRSGLWFW